jgi:hypothetical protein
MGSPFDKRNLKREISGDSADSAHGSAFNVHLAVQVNAELIVTFEGTTEFGNPFMARQSYLPTEIHWGHKFVPIMHKPPPGETRYHVDISK